MWMESIDQQPSSHRYQPQKAEGSKPSRASSMVGIEFGQQAQGREHSSAAAANGEGIHAAECNTRVPDVWMGQSAGPVSAVASEAVRRGTQGKRVYWCLVHSEWDWRGCRKDCGLHL